MADKTEELGINFLKFMANVVIAESERLPTCNEIKSFTEEIINLPVSIAIPIITAGGELSTSKVSEIIKMANSIA